MSDAGADTPRRARSWDLLDESPGAWNPSDMPPPQQRSIWERSAATGVADLPGPKRPGPRDRRVPLFLAGLVAFAVLCGLIIPNVVGTSRPDYRALCESLPVEPAQRLLGPDSDLVGFWVTPLGVTCEFARPHLSSSGELAAMWVTWQFAPTEDRFVPGERLTTTEVRGATWAGIDQNTVDSTRRLLVDVDSNSYGMDARASGLAGADGERRMVEAFEGLLPGLTRHHPTVAEAATAADNPCHGVIGQALLRRLGDAGEVWPTWSELGSSCSVLSRSDPGMMLVSIETISDQSAAEYDSLKVSYPVSEREAAPNRPDRLMISTNGERGVAHRDDVTVYVDVDRQFSDDPELITELVNSALAKRTGLSG